MRFPPQVSLTKRLVVFSIIASVLLRILSPLSAFAAVANRALLLTAGRSEPSYEMMRRQLVRLGVPFTAIDVIPTSITSGLLQTGTNGNYSMIILTTGNLAFESSPGVWESALTPEEWQTLRNYARNFAVRTIAYYTFPNTEYGLSWTGNVTTNTTGTLTSAGRSVFSDVKSTAVIPFRSYTYLATPLPGFTPWVVDAAGYPIIGRYLTPDGREILVSTADQSIYEVSSALLTPSMIRWVSRGLYTNWNVYFTMQVDDFFIGNERWPTYTEEVRMTAADLTAVIQWQQANGIRLDLAFNGEGYVPGDPLSELAKTQASQFRWVNHTFTHANLNTATYTEAYNEFRQNIELANRIGLFPFNRPSAVTGEHSGLTNPHVLAAANALSIRYLATDASRQVNPSYTSNGILLIPRYPTNIFTDVATRDEQVARYNGLYGTALTYGAIIDHESDLIVVHMLSGDPRPHFAHQINLAGDRILLDLLSATLTKYRSLSTKPIRQPTFSAIGQLLAPLAAPAP